MLFLFKLTSNISNTSNIRGKGTILPYGTFIRKARIPQKYLDKLRAKYRNFQLTEFSEYRFERKYIYPWLTSHQHTYRYYLWPSYSDAIFQSLDDDNNPDKYNKWFASPYNVFNGDSERKTTKKEVNWKTF